MSATNRGAERLVDDAYETPPWSVHRVLEKIQLPGGRWLEPCAGTGQIMQAVSECRNDVIWTATEKRIECLPSLSRFGFTKKNICDFLALDVRKLNHFDVVFTNPPYEFAQEFLEKSLQIADHVVFLLRLNYLGSVNRSAYLSQHTPDAYVLPDRPGFVLSVSCSRKKQGCKYAEICTLHESPPDVCPDCNASVRITSSDATEYAWMHFQPNVRTEGRVVILNTTPVAVRKRKTA